jgi:hypothetical protein
LLIEENRKGPLPVSVVSFTTSYDKLFVLVFFYILLQFKPAVYANVFTLALLRKSLKIPKEGNQNPYNTMANRNSTKGQRTIYKTCI